MKNFWAEYDSCANWCAMRGYKGVDGDPLPPLLSVACYDEIRDHPEDFARRVREHAYGLAMSRLDIPEEV